MAYGENLKLRGRIFWAQVAVPVKLRPLLPPPYTGRPVLSQSLRTSDVKMANAVKGTVVSRFRQMIAQAEQRPLPILPAPMARAIRLGRDMRELVGVSDRPPRSFREGEAELNLPGYAAVAAGLAIPLGAHVEAWAKVRPVKASMQAERERAIRLLKDFMASERLPPLADRVDRPLAGRFQLHLADGRGPKTVNSLVACLHAYFDFLITRGHIADRANPFAKLRLPLPRKRLKRAFTDAEIETLFVGKPSKKLLAAMAIAALSGLRASTLCALTVADADAAKRVFRIGEGKTEASSDMVLPMHPALVPVIRYLAKGRKPTDALIPFDRERRPADGLGKAFRKHRRKCGVGAGRGEQTAVDFHSFRRYLLTILERAGVPENIAARLAGHSSALGLSYGLYSKGADLPQLAKALAKCKLPDKAVEVLRVAFDRG